MPSPRAVLPLTFRVLLFGAAASLAVYIPFKYATQLHAVTGLYAFLFPLSGLLAAAGIVLSLRPRAACALNLSMRFGLGSVAVLWSATGALCLPSLAASVARAPAAGLLATFHMTAQHLFLSLTVLAFAIAPQALATALAPGSDRTSALNGASALDGASGLEGQSG